MDNTPTVATYDDMYNTIHHVVAATAVASTGSTEEVESTTLCEANGYIYYLQVHWNLLLFNSANH
jgi:hypothetical protein